MNWKALLPRTVSEWIAESLAAGLLAVSVALAATHWDMPGHFTRPEDKVYAIVLFIYALTIAFFSYAVRTLRPPKYVRQAGFWVASYGPYPLAVPPELEKRQTELLWACNRWAKLAMQWFITFTIWAIITTVEQQPLEWAAWLWPGWAVILAGTTWYCLRHDAPRELLPHHRFDWLAEVVMSAIGVALGILIVYTWEQSSFQQEALGRGLFSAYGFLLPTAFFLSTYAARVGTLLQPPYIKPDIPQEAQMVRVRLHRSRDRWADLFVPILFAGGVAVDCQWSIRPLSEIDPNVILLELLGVVLLTVVIGAIPFIITYRVEKQMGIPTMPVSHPQN